MSDEVTVPRQDGVLLRWVYNPIVEEVLGSGSTSIVGRLGPGVVLKYPRFSWWDSPAIETHHIVQDIKRSFEVEEQILKILGPHPNLITSV